MVIEFWSGWSELLYLTPSESSEEEYFLHWHWEVAAKSHFSVSSTRKARNEVHRLLLVKLFITFVTVHTSWLNPNKKIYLPWTVRTQEMKARNKLFQQFMVISTLCSLTGTDTVCLTRS